MLDELLEMKLLSQNFGEYEILLSISKFPSRCSTPISTSNVWKKLSPSGIYLMVRDWAT